MSMQMKISKGYSYDDVLLVPKLSNLSSRYESNTVSLLCGIRLEVPIVSSPMDTVTEANMALSMWEQGGFGFIHRYMDINEQFSQVKWVKSMSGRCGASVGVNGDAWDRVQALIDAGVDILIMDIAHGHNINAIKMGMKIKSEYPGVRLISPNIATRSAAFDWKFADGVRVGIGPGSACTTRLVAGVGVPQLTAVNDVYDVVKEHDCTVISDGGVRNSGDIVKALAAGADVVMIGGLFSPFDIAAGKRYYIQTDEPSEVGNIFGGEITKSYWVKEFRGMASDEALSSRKRNERYVVEGESFTTPIRYDFKDFFAKLRDGVQTGLSYLGAKDIEALREVAEFVEISPNGYVESTPHFRGGRLDDVIDKMQKSV